VDIRSFFGSRESSDEATVPDVVRISAGALASARRTLVLTGAGLSVAAGLPTYRGAGGLYTGPGGVPPFLHADALPDNVQQLWEFWAPFRESVAVAEPTVGHRALAAWQQAREASGAGVTLVTANVDDLHERAGSSRVHHLHGSVFATTCLAPGCGIRLDEDDRSLPEVATCTVCGGATRPGMVLFGEVVELDAQWAARQMLRQCEAFMCVGTSGTVSPPYSWLRYARDVGAPSILVNPDPDAGEGFDHHVRLEADVALPMLFQQ
jgi:NAD-dependent deacetylase